MADSSSAQEIGALDALGCPTRRAIVEILAKGPLPVGVIAAGLPVSRPAVSKHLRILQSVDLVAFEKRGNRNLFRLERSGFEAARGWLDSFWADALARFAMVAENTLETPRRGSEVRDE